MKIYISGRIKDYPEHRDHFLRAAVFLHRKGHEVVNPCDVGDTACAPGSTYEEYFKADARELLDCDAIFMLEGWERSVGARAEHQLAALCGLNFYYEKLEIVPYGPLPKEEIPSAS